MSSIARVVVATSLKNIFRNDRKSNSIILMIGKFHRQLAFGKEYF